MSFKLNKIIRKIYLGKTPVLTREQFFEMYENLNSFLEIKNEFDCENLFESNLEHYHDKNGFCYQWNDVFYGANQRKIAPATGTN